MRILCLGEAFQIHFLQQNNDTTIKHVVQGKSRNLKTKYLHKGILFFPKTQIIQKNQELTLETS